MSSSKPTILPARVSKNQVQQVYRRVAPLYNLWGRLTEQKARQRCLELAQLRDGEQVLEVAVGTGLLFEQVLEHNPHGQNEGIDLTQEMLARAERRAAGTGRTNYRLRPGDAYHLDFEDSRFDLLVNNYMFDLLPQSDFQAVLGEFKRVLKPGGRLVLANMTKAGHWYHGLWESVYRLNPAWMGGCRGVWLADDLKTVGFERVQRETITQFGFPSEIVMGWKAD
jgi:ubiquinone/menaquinone biosynthesis C-methylase UbiE